MQEQDLYIVKTDPPVLLNAIIYFFGVYYLLSLHFAFFFPHVGLFFILPLFPFPLSEGTTSNGSKWTGGEQGRCLASGSASAFIVSVFL
jgi:hypothetical protein